MKNLLKIVEYPKQKSTQDSNIGDGETMFLFHQCLLQTPRPPSQNNNIVQWRKTFVQYLD